jgi:hypothetical protein
MINVSWIATGIPNSRLDNLGMLDDQNSILILKVYAPPRWPQGRSTERSGRLLWNRRKRTTQYRKVNTIPMQFNKSFQFESTRAGWRSDQGDQDLGYGDTRVTRCQGINAQIGNSTCGWHVITRAVGRAANIKSINPKTPNDNGLAVIATESMCQHVLLRHWFRFDWCPGEFTPERRPFSLAVAANTRNPETAVYFELEVPGLGILEGNPGEDVWSLQPSRATLSSWPYPDQSRDPHRPSAMAGWDAFDRVRDGTF